jgi:hypothetical protein
MRAAASEAGGGGSLHRRRSRSGDVFKLCQQFENASLLGQMFTSTPDVRELNTVAPLYFSKPILKPTATKGKTTPVLYDPEVHKPKFTYRPAEDGRHSADSSRTSSRNVTFKGLIFGD